MHDVIQIWVVVAIAAVMVIASLILASATSTRHSTRLEVTAFHWLAATNLAFLVGTIGLMLGTVLPFWVSASMMITGMHLGMILGYIALRYGLGDQPRLPRYAAFASITVLSQGVLALVVPDVGVLVLSSSLINSVMGMVMAHRLWHRSNQLGRDMALLASAPFATIALAYASRLVLAGIGASAYAFTVATLIVAFLLAFSALQWSFALIAFRAARLNQSLEAARDRAEESSRMKSRFLANMSHELRTPLNGVLGMAQVLESTQKDPEQKRMLETIRESGEGLLSILNDILDLSKIEAGQMQIEMRPFDAAHSLEQTAMLFCPGAETRKLEFRVRIDPALAGWRMGDALRLRQVVSNLLSNAVKFTDRGIVALRARPFNGGIRIQVKDTGIGMSESQLASVFEEFVQADSSITRRFGGTGLGMPIVRRLVEAMGGEVRVSSMYGRGTTVTLDLPFERVEITEAAAAALDDTAPTPSSAPPPETTTTARALRPDAQQALAPAPAHPIPSAALRAATAPGPAANDAANDTAACAPAPTRRILVAEDNLVNQKVISAMLRELPFTLEFVETGRAAVERARHQTFDLFLFDVMMPELDGPSALRAITKAYARAGRPLPPAVVATAHVSCAKGDEYRSSGFVDIVPKPIRKQRLLEVLRALGLLDADMAEPGTEASAAPSPRQADPASPQAAKFSRMVG